MKLFSKRGKVYIVIIGILFVLSLNFFQKEVKSFFYLISSPAQKALWEMGDKTADFFEAITEIKNLKKENEEFNLRIQELLAENSSLKDFRKENQDLREALEIGLQKNFQLVLAEITGKDINQDSILINKGSKDGILEGFPVITQQKSLLGRVIEVYDNFSRILLISNKKSSFDAKILVSPGEAGGSDSDIAGVVKGGGSFKVFLNFVLQEEEIKEGDLVVSSALGGTYPNGLLIGLIKEVKKSDTSPFQQAEISPFFNILSMERVFLIINF